MQYVIAIRCCQSFSCDEFVEIQKDSSGRNPGGGFVGSGTTDGRVADEFFRVVWMSEIKLAIDRQEVGQLVKLTVARRASDAQAESLS